MRLAAKTYFKINMTIILYFCRTCEVVAAGEVHMLHAVGEHDLADSTLRVGRQGEGK